MQVDPKDPLPHVLASIVSLDAIDPVAAARASREALSRILQRDQIGTQPRDVPSPHGMAPDVAAKRQDGDHGIGCWVGPDSKK